MPRVPAVLVRLPSERTRTRLMNRFSNSRTASSKRTPLSTISSTSFSSRSEIMARGPWSLELPPGQALECFEVLLAGVPDHIVRQRRHWGLLVPVDLFKAVPLVLLVDARLWSAGVV